MSAPSCAHTPSPSHILQINTPSCTHDDVVDSVVGLDPPLDVASACCGAGCVDCKWLQYLRDQEQLFNPNSFRPYEVGTAWEQGKPREIGLLPYGKNIRGITWNSNAFLDAINLFRN